MLFCPFCFNPLSQWLFRVNLIQNIGRNVTPRHSGTHLGITPRWRGGQSGDDTTRTSVVENHGGEGCFRNLARLEH